MIGKGSDGANAGDRGGVAPSSAATPEDAAGGTILAALARQAVDLVTPGAWVGLGSGRTASAFITALGERVRGGLAVTGVATSESSARQARAAGIALADLEEARQLDLTVDGADEVAPNLDLVKGRGGALVRERIVAAASRRQIILVGAEKLVRGLGARGEIPVEIIPMACPLVMHRLKLLGVRPAVRLAAPAGDGATQAFCTENGNLIINCAFPVPLADREAARDLELALLEIPGVVDTGLFLGTCERVLVGYPGGRVDVLARATGAPDEDEYEDDRS
ncbi:MAG: ribose-5-phosphate isomerase RpiA [Myxococcales bacterium]